MIDDRPEVHAELSTVDTRHGLLRTRLEQAGTPIGGNDLLIAAQALTLGCTIVSDNEKEFARVEGLRMKNWVRGR